MGERQTPLKVVITDCDFGSYDLEQNELEPLADVVLTQCRTEEEVIAHAHDADGLIVQYAPITRRVIEALTKCRVIARYGIGVDMVDLQAATARGIAVVNVPDYCIDEVAEHTIALLFAAIRKIVTLHNAVAAGKWDLSVGKPIHTLRGSTIGLIGFGATARRVAQKLRGFECSLLVYKRHRDPGLEEQYGVNLVEFDAILEAADIVSIHLPLTPETQHMFGRREFQRMKPSAFLLNTSRGAIVDEDALYQALKIGQIAGAALDVVEREPLCAASQLLSLPNLILTPHAAFYSVSALQTLQRETARGVAQVLRGEVPAHLVNPKVHGAPSEE